MKKYDLYDIIARIAGLNLLPVNQNKSILLDAVIAELLCVNVYNEGIINDNIMSAGKFRKLISQVNDSDICMMIELNENLYVQNVMFHKNYLVSLSSKCPCLISSTTSACVHMVVLSFWTHL